MLYNISSLILISNRSLSLSLCSLDPTKFFGTVLGAQTNFDKNERYIVNGSHDSGKLQDILDGFIQKYVLCSNCKNPETDLHVSTKRQQISTTCKACGHFAILNTRDKLSAYIIKCPPGTDSTNTNGKESKKSKRKDKNKTEQENNNESDELVDDSLLNDTNVDHDDDWCEDTDADSVAKRMSELTSGVNRLMANNDLEKSSEERLQIFFETVKKKIDESANNGLDVNTQKDIVAEAERLEIRDKAVLVLCELSFNENILQQIKTYRTLFIRFCAQRPKAQKYLLRGFELIVKEYQNQLLPKVSHILKELYDCDIIEEKEILEWAKKQYKKTVGKELAEQIHAKATPFIKWLQEAEEENSSEEDENDSDIDVVYDDRVLGDKIQVLDTTPATKTNSNNNQSKKDLDDELDIDAI